MLFVSHIENCICLRLDNELLNKSVIYCFLYIWPEGSSIYDNNDINKGIDLLEDAILDVTSEYTDFISKLCPLCRAITLEWMNDVI